MTTRSKDILGAFCKPGDTSACYLIPLTAITGFSGDADHLALAFEASGAEDEFHTVFYVPNEYSTSATIELFWFSNHSAGDDVRWTVYFNPVANAEQVDATGWSSEEVTSSVAAAMELEVASIPLPSSLITAGDLIQCRIARSGDHSADSQNGDVFVTSARFTYDDS